ncbi:lysozyme [Brevundimonas albigilva]|uniref:lysozyme n=1 Tax=Brevundimonas albigilva TaxID=1312364 RepID=UPI00201B6DD7|nr:lysozyme [Brevundimonas albigilva]UQV18808.1 lysozyme [Brevundimonas albigilva]
MSEAVVNPNKVSRAGVILIKSFEGFRPAAVRRADGVWVIGYGHTASAREGATVSESDAELLLQYDLIPVVRAVREAVTVPLNGHQFDALASFAFSVGVERFLVSDVLVLVNAGRPQDAAAAILGWHDAAEAHLPPRRRTAERALFNTAPGAPAALVDLLMQLWRRFRPWPRRRTPRPRTPTWRLSPARTTPISEPRLRRVSARTVPSPPVIR